MEKISKPNSQGGWNSSGRLVEKLRILIAGGGEGGVGFSISFLFPFLTKKVTALTKFVYTVKL